MAAYESAPDNLVPVNSNEYSSNTFVGKFDITGMPTLLIISVSDFFSAISSRIGRIGLCYPKCLVVIQCGSQCHRTQISSRAKSVEWNKTVNLWAEHYVNYRYLTLWEVQRRMWMGRRSRLAFIARRAWQNICLDKSRNVWVTSQRIKVMPEDFSQEY